MANHARKQTEDEVKQERWDAIKAQKVKGYVQVRNKEQKKEDKDKGKGATFSQREVRRGRFHRGISLRNSQSNCGLILSLTHPVTHSYYSYTLHTIP